MDRIPTTKKELSKFPADSFEEEGKKLSAYFVTLIRVCLTQHNRAEYIVNEIKIKVQKANKIREAPPGNQTSTGTKWTFSFALLD